ncbi:carboxypeptidase regulatory-like domain-containing protein [Sutcliffiella sp. BMC8]|uniref:carboxypeptidase regulatory-like domain-containing protein n=1 Tax=Sutcliffiella sp. BMC8 TaxID=3073243 RepID=UPI0030D00907
MKRGKKGKIGDWKRFVPILFILILLSNSVLPYVASANDENVNDSQSQDIELEKEREMEYQEQMNKVEDIELERGELLNVLLGLEWDPPSLLQENEVGDITDIEKVETAIVEELKEKKTVDIIVRLKDKAEPKKAMMNATGKMSHEDRVKLVTDNLQKHASENQKGIISSISTLEKKGMASNVESLWIINGLTLTVDKDGLEELKSQQDVDRITLDRVIEAPEITTEGTKPRLPEWGLEKIKATNVWGEYGLKGEGIVIGIMDSGVDGTHEALAHNYRGRDGNHQYSWIDVSGQNYSTPQDGYGHGTHVAGTAVGGGDGEPIGVAPEAEWIAAKIFTDGGSATISGIHRAFEWFMAPGGDPSKAPHIVNNSWGNPNTFNKEFYEDVQAWVAAGIFPLFAAGNEGPGAQTVGSPGSFPESFTIGATDSNDQVASFSSRGPVYWIDEEGNQQRLLKPNVTAPGHQVYSAWPGVRGQGKYNTISGTSMATPHVAGAIALLLQANPNLSIQDMKDLLADTARQEQHMGTLPNDLYGEGIINIYQAVTETAYAGQLKGTVQTEDGNDVPIKIEIPTQEISVEVAEGPFELSVREGKHKVIVKAFGYKPFEVEVVIKKGESTSVSWSLESSDRYELKGKVVDKETQAEAAHPYISLKGTPINTRGDASGNFKLSNIPEGEYELVVTGEGFKGVSKQIEVTGKLELTIEVESYSSTYSREWTTANSRHDRNAVSANAIDSNELSQQWEYLNGTKGQILFASPSASKKYVVFTTDRGWVTALDARSGDEIWSIRLGSSNRSTPTIVDETVYLSGGQDGTIYALNILNGNIKWSKSIGQPAIYESPLYKDGTLIVSSGLTDNASVYALDARDGKELWSSSLGGSSFFGGAIGDQLVYIGSYENRTIRALQITDGAEVWSKQISQEGFASRPVYHEGTVYVQTSNFGNGAGSLLAINGNTGEIVWQVAGVGDSQAGSPIIYENLVMVGSSSMSILRAFNKTTGEEVWSNRSVGTALHNGAVSANGVLLFSGTSGMLQALDVYSGSVLKDFSLPDYSTSGSLILPGNVVVPHRNGIVSFQSPGTLEGDILGENGEGLSAKISVLETEEEGDIFNDGSYSFKHQPGEFTLKVSYYGKKQITEKVTFVSGYKQVKNFTLSEAESGGLELSVKDERTGENLSGVEVVVKDTPLTSTTDDNGYLQFDGIYEGSYEVELKLNGFKEWTDTITIEPDSVNSIEVNMQPFDIAVLNDWEGEVTSLLNSNGFFAEERDWDIVDDIDRYKTIYLNGAYGTGGWRPDAILFNELVDKAEQHEVNLVFADSWGSGYGSIRQLTEYNLDPKEIAHYNGMGQVRLQVDEEHPILNGFSKGDRITLFTRTGDFAWFNQHSGRHLASIGSTTQGTKGTGISYKAVSENAAHLLLANHGASPWISPLQGWLPDMQAILFNGLRYLHDAEFGKVTGTVVDLDGNPVKAEVGIVETNISTKTEGEQEAFELFHDEGEFTIEVRASGFATQTEQVVIEHGNPLEIQVVLTSSNGDKVSGVITDGMSKQPIAEAVVKMVKDDEVVVERETSANGRFEFTGLEYGTYTLQVEKEGYIKSTQRMEVGRVQGDVNVELFATPRVAVLKDYSFSSRNFQSLMGDAGIPVTPLTFTNVMEEIKNYDVLFINEASNSDLPLTLFNSLMKQADQAGTSVIFGDNNGSTAAIARLVALREDPTSRRTITDTTKSAGYVVMENHPLFKGAENGDFLEMTIPSGGRIATFDGYTGYTLASIKHEGNDSVHGPAVAFKPRTSGNIELLVSGHGFGTFRHKDHYTPQGKDFLVNAVLWAAYAEFQTIFGTLMDEEGEPIKGTVSVEGEAFSAETDPETGAFSIAMVDGDYDITIEAFGYESLSKSVRVDSSSEPLALSLQVDDRVGTISGVVENESNGNALEGVQVDALNVPREAITNTQGSFRINKIMPGTYQLLLTKEGFVNKEVSVVVEENGEMNVNISLKPSPTIGIIVDSTSSGAVTMKQYLEEKGYNVVDMDYSDLDMIEDVDLVIANSDYDNNKIPTAAEFKAFQEVLDSTETSVIWTGQHAGRGGIRFMNTYDSNPGVAIGGSQAGIQGLVYEEHPIVAGVPMNELFPVSNGSNYFYAFDEYDGETIAKLTTASGDRIGEMIGYKGRTNHSVEVLLANFTFGHPYHPGLPQYFDEHRERIFNNTLTWILDNRESLVGELNGKIVNEKEMEVQATVTVLETGKTISTNQQGEFYLGLPAGSYTMKVEAFGHLAQEFPIVIENGGKLEETFEIMTDQSGVIKTIVKDGQSGAVVEGATITILETPVSGITDSEGVFEAVVPVGSYSVRVTAPGFAPALQNNVVVEEDGVNELTFHLDESEKIGVVGTAVNGGRIVSLLEQRGYDTELHLNSSMNNLIDNISDYALIIFNDKHSSMNNEQFRSFIELADANQVSMIFPSQMSNGTVRELSSVFRNPESVGQNYVPGEVQVAVDQNHPIFDGFTSDRISILQNGTNSVQYAVYEGYSGTTIGTLHHPERGLLGSGIGYEYRTANSVHVLLSGLHAGTYGHPDLKWTEDAKELYFNAVDWAISASLGEVTGTVRSADGEAIPNAKVVIDSLGMETTTNSSGQYKLGVGTGTYEIKASARGYLEQIQEIQLSELGEEIVADFELEKIEGSSISVEVTNQEGEAIKGAKVKLTSSDFSDLEDELMTNEEGAAVFTDLLDGEYVVTVTLAGYMNSTEKVLLEGDDTAITLVLSAIEVAVLGDWNESLTNFLNGEGLYAEARDWTIVDEIEHYKLVVVNTSKGTEAQMNALLEKSEEFEVSLVFAGTWGDGSIPLYSKISGYPVLDQQGYKESAVSLKVQEGHPIYNGIEPDEAGLIDIHVEQSPYATFKEYPGEKLSNMYVNGEDNGTAIAYEFKGKKHMHLLLSSFAATNMIGPDKGWTEDGKQVYVQALRFAMEAEREEESVEPPGAPEWEEKRIQTGDKPVLVKGIAEPLSTVHIYQEKDGEKTIIASVDASKEGTFSAELPLKNGSTFLVAQAENEGGLSEWSDTLQVIVIGKPIGNPREHRVPEQPVKPMDETKKEEVE